MIDGIDPDLTTHLRWLADRYGGMTELCNAAALLADEHPLVRPMPPIGDAATRLIAIDRVTGAIAVRDLVAGDYEVIPVAPARVVSQESEPGGHTVTMRVSPAGAARRVGGHLGDAGAAPLAGGGRRG